MKKTFSFVLKGASQKGGARNGPFGEAEKLLSHLDALFFGNLAFPKAVTFQVHLLDTPFLK